MANVQKVVRWAAGPFILFACVTQLALGQNRYAVEDDDAMGAGSPRVVVLHDHVTGAEVAVAPSEGGELSSFKVRAIAFEIHLNHGWYLR
jgi:hypothetical protein